MKTGTIKQNKISIILCFLFLIAGCILMFLFLSKNLSEYLPMLPDFTNLMYLPIFLVGGISSFALSVLFLILCLIQIKVDINKKLFTGVLIVALIAFCSLNIINTVKTIKAFDEETHFSDVDDTFFNILPAPESVLQFFPYYNKMENATEQIPYYGISKYTLDNTVYIIAQHFCDDYEKTCTFTTEYFQTDKSYLFEKYTSEKIVHYSMGENGEILNSSLIKHGCYRDIEYDIIEQSREKLLIVVSEDYYFLFNYKDTMDALNLSTQNFIDTAFTQLEVMKQYS